MFIQEFGDTLTRETWLLSKGPHRKTLVKALSQSKVDFTLLSVDESSLWSTAGHNQDRP